MLLTRGLAVKHLVHTLGTAQAAQTEQELLDQSEALRHRSLLDVS